MLDKERVGGHRPIVWGIELSDEKETNIKYIAALNGRHLMILNATTNQKQVVAMKRVWRGGVTRGRCGGNAIPLFWGRWTLNKR